MDNTRKRIIGNINGKYETIKTIYMCFMAVYVAVREVPALHFLVGSSVLSALVFLAGAALVAWGLFSCAGVFGNRRTDLLVLYIAIAVVSCLINRQYGISENIRALGTMGIFYFLLFAIPAGGDEKKTDREQHLFLLVLSIVWVLFVIASIVMYYYTVQTVVVKVTGEVCTQGFNTQYRRLWGVFHDPNYAGFVCVAVGAFFVWIFASTEKIVLKVLSALAVLLQVCYVVLGGSRSAQVALYAAITVGVCYAVASGKRFAGAEKGVLRRLLAGGCAVVVALGAMFCCVEGLSYLLPLTKRAVVSVSSESFVAGVDAVCDGIFRISGLEIITTSAENRQEDDFLQELEEESKEPLRRTDLGKEDVSNGRFSEWAQALRIFAKSPMFGTSPRNIRAFAKEHNPDTVMAKYGTPSHNGYIDVLVSTGVIGGATMLAFLILCFIAIFKKYFLFEGDRNFFLAVTVLCAASMAGVFVSDLFYLLTPNAVLFWYFLGRVCGAEGIRRSPGLLQKPLQRLFRQN